jgi:hypothetical protein
MNEELQDQSQDCGSTRPLLPDQEAMALARTVVGRTIVVDHKEHNLMIRLARDAGIPHERVFFGPDSATARSVIDEVADANLRSLSVTTIKRKRDGLRARVGQSIEHSRLRFDPTRLGGRGAAGRQRDRARASESRNNVSAVAERLQAELDRRETENRG